MTKVTANLTKEKIKSVWKLKQADAAEMLNVSTATLKRYFYKLFPGMRWPYKGPLRGKHHTQKQYNRKLGIFYIVNDKNVNEKILPKIIVTYYGAFFPQTALTTTERQTFNCQSSFL